MRTPITIKILSVIIAAGACALIAAPRAEAASYSFRASSAVVHLGQEIAVDVIVDPEGQNLNTVEASIRLPGNLSFIDSDDSSSVVGLWVDQPKYDARTSTFSFSGIIPGGFSGLIDPFSTGDHRSGGTVMRLYMRGKSVGAGTLSFPVSNVWLSDSLGTEASVTSKDITIVVDTLVGGPVFESPDDTEAPLPFTPTLERDILLYDGKYVVIFNTKDKVSGVDHYDIKEGDGEWMPAESPYLLKDQKVRGDITIRAVDGAGNVQYATIQGLRHFEPWQVLAAFGALLALLLVLLLRKSRKEKKPDAAAAIVIK